MITQRLTGIICALTLCLTSVLSDQQVSAAAVKKLWKLARLDLPGGGEPRVVTITDGPPVGPEVPLFLGGSLTLDGIRRPALWRSVDGEKFELLPIEANPGYGEVCEIFAIAAIGEQVAATCQAFGGAHGNARTSAFVRSGIGEPLREITSSFELYNGPRQIAVKSIAAIAGGFVIFGSRVNRNGALGAASWTTSIAEWAEPPGPEFVLHDNDAALSSTGQEQVQGLSISSDGAGGLIAGGERLWWKPNLDDQTENDTDTDAALWTSTDGVEWKRSARLRLVGPGAQRLHALTQHENTVYGAGTQTVGDTVSAVVWAPKRRVVRELGNSGDVLSAATSIAVSGRLVAVGARMSESGRLAISQDGGAMFQTFALPKDAPIGARTRVTLRFGKHAHLLVALSGESGGALFSISLG